ncbi:hypothetical protein JVU11DRAFT_5579 [Chiua virens]|nr:hypothetical protein JVU11DRAFT_5579 [Chiua virens]
MAWTTITWYKTRSRGCPGDTRITSPKPLDNGMPSSPVPFVTPSSLVTFQHDLKARISSSPLLKVPLTMRPLIKKRTSIPFGLTLKRHSMTIFSRSSSSSSDASTCTPVPEVMVPMSMACACVAVDSRPETPLNIRPAIGSKIMERFWPEEEESHSEESCGYPPSRYPTVLAPPPHHRRRAPRSLGPARDVPFGNELHSRTTHEHAGPLRFPF